MIGFVAVIVALTLVAWAAAQSWVEPMTDEQTEGAKTTPAQLAVTMKVEQPARSDGYRPISDSPSSSRRGRRWGSGQAQAAAARSPGWLSARHDRGHRHHQQQRPRPASVLDSPTHQWEFRVMGVRRLAEHSGRSVTLAFLDRHAPTVLGLADLRQAVEEAPHQA